MASETALFITVAAALVGQMGDCYTTERNLARGLVEANPVAKWLQGHIGNTGLTIIKCAGFAVSAPMLLDIFYSAAAAIVVAAVAAAAGIAATVLNVRAGRAYAAANVPKAVTPIVTTTAAKSTTTSSTAK